MWAGGVLGVFCPFGRFPARSVGGREGAGGGRRGEFSDHLDDETPRTGGIEDAVFPETEFGKTSLCACVVGIGFEDDECEALAGQEVEKEPQGFAAVSVAPVLWAGDDDAQGALTCFFDEVAGGNRPDGLSVQNDDAFDDLAHALSQEPSARVFFEGDGVGCIVGPIDDARFKTLRIEVRVVVEFGRFEGDFSLGCFGHVIEPWRQARAEGCLEVQVPRRRWPRESYRAIRGRRADAA